MGFGLFKNDNPGRTCAGLAFSIVIGCLIFFSFDKDAVSGCAGDCMTCHPQLKDDKTHQSLQYCIECHDPAKPKFKVSASLLNGCGDRCFLCHSEWPKDSAHVSLDGCLDCHTK